MFLFYELQLDVQKLKTQLNMQNVLKNHCYFKAFESSWIKLKVKPNLTLNH